MIGCQVYNAFSLNTVANRFADTPTDFLFFVMPFTSIVKFLAELHPKQNIVCRSTRQITLSMNGKPKFGSLITPHLFSHSFPTFSFLFYSLFPNFPLSYLIIIIIIIIITTTITTTTTTTIIKTFVTIDRLACLD